MPRGRSHEKLVAWSEAMELVIMVYGLTRSFPREELFGLTAQLRRSAVSIPSNIAEGAARNSSRELLQFVGIACGSVAELETQLQLAMRLGYVPQSAERILDKASRVGLLVRRLRKALALRSL